MTKKSVSRQSLSDILTKFKSILAFSTDRANQLVFLIPAVDNFLIKKMRISRVKGFDYNNGKLAVMGSRHLFVYNKFNLQKPKLNKKIVAGITKAHDVQIVNNQIIFCNTEKSFVSTFNHKFTHQQPSFISNLTVKDCCHLNGLAVTEKAKCYVTCLSKSNEEFGWKKDLTQGVLYALENNKEILGDLHIPHSPRIYKRKLYFLESGKGQLSVCLNNKKKVLLKTSNFLRGLCFYQDLAFIGVSSVRSNRKLPVKSKTAGIIVFDLKSKKIVARYELDNFKEIYDLKLLPIKEVYAE